MEFQNQQQQKIKSYFFGMIASLVNQANSMKGSGIMNHPSASKRTSKSVGPMLHLTIGSITALVSTVVINLLSCSIFSNVNYCINTMFRDPRTIPTITIALILGILSGAIGSQFRMEIGGVIFAFVGGFIAGVLAGPLTLAISALGLVNLGPSVY